MAPVESGLSSQNIIVVAACATVGGLVLTVILYRLVRYIQAISTKSNPLPPRQPLAHHREQRISKFHGSNPPSRPGTIYDSALLSVPPLNFSNISIHGSRTSLMSKESLPSNQHSVLNINDDDPSFLIPTSHTLSDSSYSFDSTEQPIASSPDTPVSLTSSPLSHSSTRRLTARHSSQSSSRSRPQSSSRPLSLSSNASTMRGTIRGTPHSRHSNIQIVLPTPLAPEVFPYLPLEDRNRTSAYEPDRQSMLDRWTPLPTSSLSPHSRPLSISSDRRVSRSVSYSQPGNHHPRRMSSNLSSASSTSYSPDDPSAPPVPRIPSMYMEYVEDSRGGNMTDWEIRRGRSQASLTNRRASSVPPVAFANKPATLVKPRSRSQSRKTPSNVA